MVYMYLNILIINYLYNNIYVYIKVYSYIKTKEYLLAKYNAFNRMFLQDLRQGNYMLSVC